MYGPSIGVLNLRITRHGKEGEEPWQILWAKAGSQGNRCTIKNRNAYTLILWILNKDFLIFCLEKLGNVGTMTSLNVSNSTNQRYMCKEGCKIRAGTVSDIKADICL